MNRRGYRVDRPVDNPPCRSGLKPRFSEDFGRLFEIGRLRYLYPERCFHCIERNSKSGSRREDRLRQAEFRTSRFLWDHGKFKDTSIEDVRSRASYPWPTLIIS